MSTRMVRRILQQRQQADERPQEEQTVVDDDEEEDDEDDMPARVTNAFDILGLDDETTADGGDDGEEAEDQPADRDDGNGEVDTKDENGDGEESKHISKEVTIPSTKRTEAGGKKGKKKNRGKKKSAFANEPSEEDIAGSLDKVKAGEVIEGAQAGTVTNKALSSHSHGEALVSTRPILAVDPRNLRPDEELRRIFGSKVIRTVDKRLAAGAGAGGRNAGRRGGVGVSRRGGLKRGLLVEEKDHWPPAAAVERGLTMEYVREEDEVVTPAKSTPIGASSGKLKQRVATGSSTSGEFGGGGKVFKYVRSALYAAVQAEFEHMVATHDPNALAMHVARHPYHAEGLLALSDVYRQIGEMHTSADLLERALFALEAAWHPWFNPCQATCRLDFTWAPNRTFFTAVLRQMQAVGRRGCHRAAFELCKLLLSLDPSADPLGALQCIDFYALRARQGHWLAELVAQWDSAGRPVATLPNFAFGLAMAKLWEAEQVGEEEPTGLLQDRKGGRVERWDVNGSKEGVEGHGVGRSWLGRLPSADSLLLDALLLHPYVLPRLVEKAPVKTDGAVASDWSRVLRHELFASTSAGSATLQHLVELYVERSASLWRDGEAQTWLLKVAVNAVEKAERERRGDGGEGVSGSGPKGAAHETDDGAVATWACVRGQLFQEAKNEYRHLTLADFSDSTPTLPPEELRAIPNDPRDGNVGPGFGFVVGEGQGGVQQGGGADAVAARPDLAGRNPMAVFVEALMPWNDAPGGQLQALVQEPVLQEVNEQDQVRERRPTDVDDGEIEEVDMEEQ